MKLATFMALRPVQMKNEFFWDAHHYAR